MSVQRSTISFEEVCTVDADQTARRLFARLSHGNAYASRMVEGLATGYLIAIVESICIREMLREMSLTTEVIVGAAVDVRHRAPVPPGKQIWLRGQTTHLDERTATFAVRAWDDDEIVSDGVMTFVVTSRERIETRLALKLSADNRAPGGASEHPQRNSVPWPEAGFSRVANAAMTPCRPTIPLGKHWHRPRNPDEPPLPKVRLHRAPCPESLRKAATPHRTGDEGIPGSLTGTW